MLDLVRKMMKNEEKEGDGRNISDENQKTINYF